MCLPEFDSTKILNCQLSTLNNFSHDVASVIDISQTHNFFDVFYIARNVMCRNINKSFLYFFPELAPPSSEESSPGEPSPGKDVLLLPSENILEKSFQPLTVTCCIYDQK